MPVESHKPGIGELGRRAQLASAECAWRPAAVFQMGFDRVKALRQRQHSRQPGALDRKTRLRRDTARILKRMLDKTVAAWLKRYDICHCPVPISVNRK